MIGSLAEDPQISSSEEEDEFCDTCEFMDETILGMFSCAYLLIVRQLGAQWIKDWFDYPERSKLFKNNIIQIGWPSEGGGVWALHIMRSSSGQLPVALIYSARNMDEKCEIIRLLGGGLT
ncbi:hypothetical protein DPV78_008920 [Talaromyces pinophilus]|nr:hypothetical protein DPV78_008920 [Talaromyces pinophilus]